MIHDRTVIDATNSLVQAASKHPEEALPPQVIEEHLEGLTTEKRTAVLLRLAAAQRDATRRYQISITNKDAASAMVWGVSCAVLSELCEGVTVTIPGLEDPVASRSTSQWLAAEAKRYLVLKANATIILPDSVGH